LSTIAASVGRSTEHMTRNVNLMTTLRSEIREVDSAALTSWMSAERCQHQGIKASRVSDSWHILGRRMSWHRRKEDDEWANLACTASRKLTFFTGNLPPTVLCPGDDVRVKCSVLLCRAAEHPSDGTCGSMCRRHLRRKKHRPLPTSHSIQWCHGPVSDNDREVGEYAHHGNREWGLPRF
jgi:hypothetical protein